MDSSTGYVSRFSLLFSVLSLISSHISLPHLFTSSFNSLLMSNLKVLARDGVIYALKHVLQRSDPIFFQTEQQILRQLNGNEVFLFFLLLPPLCLFLLFSLSSFLFLLFFSFLFIN